MKKISRQKRKESHHAKKNAFTRNVPCGIIVANETDEEQIEMLTTEQISRIRVRGYKSIKDCDLSLGNVNVLIGGNGAGKSNFISVFSLIQNILQKRLQLTVGVSGLNPLFYNGRKVTETIAIEAFFGNNSYGFELVATDENRLIFQNEYFGYYLNFANQTTLSVGHEESKWSDGTKNGINGYVQPILQKQAWRVYHFHDTSRSSVIKQEHNVVNSQSLMEDGRNLAAFLFRLKNQFLREYKEIVQSIRLVAPYFDDFVLEPQELNPNLIVLRWKQRGCDDVFNAHQLSDGTLRFICLTALLLQPKELRAPTIIIDEPELGLHPLAISILGEMIHQVSQETQIIISTQSVELLNEFEVEEVIVVDRSNDGSVFKRLSEEKLAEWLEDYTLGDLWKKNLLGGRVSG